MEAGLSRDLLRQRTGDGDPSTAVRVRPAISNPAQPAPPHLWSRVTPGSGRRQMFTEGLDLKVDNRLFCFEVIQQFANANLNEDLIGDGLYKGDEEHGQFRMRLQQAAGGGQTCVCWLLHGCGKRRGSLR